MSHSRTKKIEVKRFMVALKSSNHNAFGLHGYVLIAEDGEAWEVGRTLCSPWQVGHIVEVSNGKSALKWAGVNCEIPRRLPDAPDEVVSLAWASKITKA